MNKDNTAASMSKLMSMTSSESSKNNGHTDNNKSEKKLKLTSGNNYIHIDLKGARFQLHFWINFCRLVRDWGDVKGI